MLLSIYVEGKLHLAGATFVHHPECKSLRRSIKQQCRPGTRSRQSVGPRQAARSDVTVIVEKGLLCPRGAFPKRAWNVQDGC
jgi:hypothetical protein